MAIPVVEASREDYWGRGDRVLPIGTALCGEVRDGLVHRPYSRCLRGTVSVITICQSNTAESGRRPRDKAAARNSLPLQKPGFSEKPGFFTRPPVTDFLPRTNPYRTAEPATFFTASQCACDFPCGTHSLASVFPSGRCRLPHGTRGLPAHADVGGVGRVVLRGDHGNAVHRPPGGACRRSESAGMEAASRQPAGSDHRQMSTYLTDSEISRFNRYEGDDWFAVSAEVARVVATALEVSRSSQGAFDVTVGPLVNLWGFGPAGRPGAVPTEEAVAACRSRVGYGLLEVRDEPPALRKHRATCTSTCPRSPKVSRWTRSPGSWSDAECAATWSKSAARSALVEGNPMAACGGSGSNAPSPASGRSRCVVELDGRSLATSGDYRNFFELQGRRYSHEIDPRTGRPVEHAWFPSPCWPTTV